MPLSGTTTYRVAVRRPRSPAARAAGASIAFRNGRSAAGATGPAAGGTMATPTASTSPSTLETSTGRVGARRIARWSPTVRLARDTPAPWWHRSSVTSGARAGSARHEDASGRAAGRPGGGRHADVRQRRRAGGEELLGGRLIVEGEDGGRRGRHRGAGCGSSTRAGAGHRAGAADPPDDGRCEHDDRGDDRDQQQRATTALLPRARPAAVRVVGGGE